jgi:hypothetical protein
MAFLGCKKFIKTLWSEFCLIKIAICKIEKKIYIFTHIENDQV